MSYTSRCRAVLEVHYWYPWSARLERKGPHSLVTGLSLTRVSLTVCCWLNMALHGTFGKITAITEECKWMEYHDKLIMESSFILTG